MKMMQQDGNFRPIAVVLESEEDAMRLWDIVSHYEQSGPSVEARRLAIDINNWLATEAKL